MPAVLRPQELDIWCGSAWLGLILYAAGASLIVMSCALLSQAVQILCA